MARVVEAPPLPTRIDQYLGYLLDQWAGIPEVAAEWDEWDEESRLTFIFNWGVPQDRFHQLDQWAAQGLLSTEQRARYHELLRLVAQHRPTLERLLNG